VSHESGDASPDIPSEQEKAFTKDLPGVAAFATMGMSAAIVIALGVVLGLWADSAWGSEPWGLLIAAVVSVVKQVRRFL
jgi:F0F1-type ATP synthase assembly protein I